MPREVVLYASSATGMLTTKKYITSIQNLLNAKQVPFTEIDCAVELEKRDAMAAISGTKVLPQVFVDGKFIGGWAELEAINEEDRFDEVFK